MTTFLDNLTSLSWWLGVVCVGIAINLVSAYVKKRLDRQLGSFSRLWRVRSAKKKEDTNNLIQSLRSDPHKVVLYSIEQANKGIQAVFMTFFGMFSSTIAIGFLLLVRNSDPNLLLLIPLLVLAFGGIVMMFVGFLFWSDSMEMSMNLSKSKEVQE